MSVPVIFYPTTKARAADVNRNFQYVMQLLGTAIGTERLQTPREFLMGGRQNALLSSLHDTGNPGYKYWQLSWNVEWERNPAQPSQWIFSDRIVAGENAAAIRVGEKGFQVLGTSATTGEINGAMRLMFSVTPTLTEDRIYIGETWHIQRYDGIARNIQDYRLTYTIMEQPASIFEAQAVNEGEVVYNATNYGVPSTAKAIMISAYVTAGSSAANLWCYAERSPRNKKHGFGVSAPANGDGAGQGVVRLGEGSYNNLFVIKRTKNFTDANVFIVGYFV